MTTAFGEGSRTVGARRTLAGEDEGCGISRIGIRNWIKQDS
jgi:hypothetical protein